MPYSTQNGFVNTRNLVFCCENFRESQQLEADEPLAFGGHGALDEVEVVEGDAGAHGDAFEGVVGDVAGDADLLGHEAVEVAEEGGAAGEDDAAVDDV